MDEVLKTDKRTLYIIEKKFKKTLTDYRLIEDNDHILIGISGGKDSLALVELLGQQMKLKVPEFKVTAAHISVENIKYQSDLPYLQQFTENIGIPFIHSVTSFDESTDSRKTKCFLCSWQRRKALFEIAKKLNCNKIALGHHLDDAVETLLMNMFFQGSFSTAPPKLKMNKFDITIIRPLTMIPEKEIIEMERIKAYKKQIKNCPYEKDSYRTKVKKLITELEVLNPNIRQCIWSSMENINTEYLPEKRVK
jgi:tRNA 2-thiocytidine biosynthesis protein TtcA